jgi:hypothetical protein
LQTVIIAPAFSPVTTGSTMFWRTRISSLRSETKRREQKSARGATAAKRFSSLSSIPSLHRCGAITRRR